VGGRESGTEIEDPQDATQEGTTMTDHQEEIETCLTIEGAVVEDDVEIEAIVMADLEEVLDGSARRALVLHLRRRNRHQILQMSYRSWSGRDD
jgi:hypothetical protein